MFDVRRRQSSVDDGRTDGNSSRRDTPDEGGEVDMVNRGSFGDEKKSVVLLDIGQEHPPPTAAPT